MMKTQASSIIPFYAASMLLATYSYGAGLDRVDVHVHLRGVTRSGTLGNAGGN